MRKNIALAGLGIAIAASLLPVASASAYCWSISPDGDMCFNPCYGIDNAYQSAEESTGGLLPDRTFYCLD